MKLRALSVENHPHGNRILFTLDPGASAQDFGAFIEKQRKSDQLVMIIDDNTNSIVPGSEWALELVAIDPLVLGAAPASTQTPRAPDGPPPAWLDEQEKLRQAARLSSSLGGLVPSAAGDSRASHPSQAQPGASGSTPPALKREEVPADALVDLNVIPPEKAASEVEMKNATTQEQPDKVEVNTEPNPPAA